MLQYKQRCLRSGKEANPPEPQPEAPGQPQGGPAGAQAGDPTGAGGGTIGDRLSAYSR